MKLEKFTYFPEAMKQVVNEPGGGIEQNLTFWAVKAQNRAKTLLSRPYERGVANPPAGPPKRRTGDLIASVHVGSTTMMPDGLISVPVNSAAYHGSRNYSQILREQGYVFIRPDQIVA